MTELSGGGPGGHRVDVPIMPGVPSISSLTHVRCSFGGSGVSRPGFVAIVLTVDLASAAEIRFVTVVGIDILDASGAPVARAVPPVELQISLPGLGPDHNPITAPLSGSLAAGSTTRLCAAATLTPVPDAYGATLRYRATLLLEGGAADAALVVDGPLDAPWATAGPSPP